MNVKTEPIKAPSLVSGSRRGKPGRPRHGDTGIFGKPEPGHNVGTATMKPRTQSGDSNGTAVSVTVASRLLDLRATAAYLGVSEWTVRDLEAAGTLLRIRIPLPNAGELRKLLFDRADLDSLIDLWKHAP